MKSYPVNHRSRRVVRILLVVLGLGVVAWFGWRSPSGSAIVSPEPVQIPTATSVSSPAAPIERDDTRSSAELATIEPVRGEEPDAAVAQAEPTEAELTTFAHVCPPGTIEGIVLRGLVAVAGGWAWLGAESSGGLPWGSPEGWDASIDVSRTQIGPDGVFRFEGLSPGDYGVGIRTPDGTARHVYVTLQPREESTRIRIVLGAGGIRGRVYDDQGEACAGWQIGLNNWGNTLAGVQLIDGREADSNGAFEFDSLVSGNYVLTAFPAAGLRDPRMRTVSVELQPGEWKTVDLGAPRDACRWTGRVLLPRGEPLALMALTELRIESDEVRQSAALSRGDFRIVLAAGTYDLSLFCYSGGVGPVALGKVILPAGDLGRDVTVPGALVRIRAKYGGTRLESKDALSSLSARLELADVGWKLSSARDEHGNECFLAIPPGEHTLWCTLPIQGAPGGRLPVMISEADTEVEVDVLVGDN